MKQPVNMAKREAVVVTMQPGPNLQQFWDLTIRGSWNLKKAVTLVESIIKKIAELTEEDPVRVNGKSVLSELEAWDSLAMVSFIVFASTEFGVEINGIDLREAVTVSDLQRLIGNRIKNDKN